MIFDDITCEIYQLNTPIPNLEFFFLFTYLLPVSLTIYVTTHLDERFDFAFYFVKFYPLFTSSIFRNNWDLR